MVAVCPSVSEKNDQTEYRYVITMPVVLVRMCTDSFPTEVKEPNPRKQK